MLFFPLADPLKWQQILEFKAILKSGTTTCKLRLCTACYEDLSDTPLDKFGIPSPQLSTRFCENPYFEGHFFCKACQVNRNSLSLHANKHSGTFNSQTFELSLCLPGSKQKSVLIASAPKLLFPYSSITRYTAH